MSKQFQSRTELLKEIEQLKSRVAELEKARSGLPKASVSDSEPSQQFRNLFEQAGDSIFIIEAETLRITTANLNAARRLGYSLDELYSMRFNEIEIGEAAKLEDSDSFAWQSTVSGLFVYETIHRRKDGSTMPVEVSSSIIQMDGRQIIQNVVRDLTRRRLVEQRNREIYLERERVSLLSNFIEKASHEFRTPLSIIATSSFILERADETEKRQRHSGIINKQVEHISNLVDSLITLSTLTKEHVVSLSPVDATHIVGTLVEKLLRFTSDSPIEIVAQINPEPLMIAGNSEYLMLALQQLCDNAIKNTEGAGQITVVVRPIGKNLTIEIEDTGRGIDPDDLPYIFETFYRADQSGTTRGLGLGLTIVSMIVEIHSGKIEVESEEGQGSLFRILIPLAE